MLLERLGELDALSGGKARLATPVDGDPVVIVRIVSDRVAVFFANGDAVVLAIDGGYGDVLAGSNPVFLAAGGKADGVVCAIGAGPTLIRPREALPGDQDVDRTVLAGKAAFPPEGFVDGLVELLAGAVVSGQNQAILGVGE